MELIKLNDKGVLVASSLDVAELFGKQHKNVLQSIKNLECSGEFGALNFQPTSYTDSWNRTKPMYEMTRDGFTFLAMGFRGSKAAKFKEDCINAFNKMEAELMKIKPMSQVELIVATGQALLEQERKLKELEFMN